ELPADEEIEADDRQRIDERIGGEQGDDGRAGLGIEGVDGDRSGHQVVGAQQDEGDEEGAPDIDEGPDHDDHDAGPDHRQSDVEEGLQRAGAGDHGALFVGLGNAVDEVSEDEHGSRQQAAGKDQDHRDVGVDEADGGDDEEDRHHGGGAGNHRGKQQQHIGDGALAGNGGAAERVGGEGGGDADEDDAADALDQAVEQAAQREGVAEDRLEIGQSKGIGNGDAQFGPGVERREQEPDQRQREQRAKDGGQRREAETGEILRQRELHACTGFGFFLRPIDR